MMKWIQGILLSFVMITVPATAAIDPTVQDDSTDELVNLYLSFPCDALNDMYLFYATEYNKLIDRRTSCMNTSDKSTYKYGHVMCALLLEEQKFIDVHMDSMSTAFFLVCNEQNGEYLEPRVAL